MIFIIWSVLLLRMVFFNDRLSKLINISIDDIRERILP